MDSPITFSPMHWWLMGRRPNDPAACKPFSRAGCSCVEARQAAMKMATSRGIASGNGADFRMRQLYHVAGFLPRREKV